MRTDRLYPAATGRRHEITLVRYHISRSDQTIYLRTGFDYSFPLSASIRGGTVAAAIAELPKPSRRSFQLVWSSRPFLSVMNSFVRLTCRSSGLTSVPVGTIDGQITPVG